MPRSVCSKSTTLRSINAEPRSSVSDSAIWPAISTGEHAARRRPRSWPAAALQRAGDARTQRGRERHQRAHQRDEDAEAAGQRRRRASIANATRPPGADRPSCCWIAGASAPSARRVRHQREPERGAAENQPFGEQHPRDRAGARRRAPAARPSPCCGASPAPAAGRRRSRTRRAAPARRRCSPSAGSAARSARGRRGPRSVSRSSSAAPSRAPAHERC